MTQVGKISKIIITTNEAIRVYRVGRRTREYKPSARLLLLLSNISCQPSKYFVLLYFVSGKMGASIQRVADH